MLKNKFYIDSNVFFYSIIVDRVYGRSCIKVLKMIYTEDIRAVISSTILLEVANALRKYGIPKIFERIKSILSLPLRVVDVTTDDILRAIELSEKYKLSPYDALHVIVMDREGLRDIISTDRDFDKIDWITRIDPQDLHKTRSST
ncbi:MAG: type II toxin-antitoxin system VapC family toxin [Thermoprotei archaeon]|nr:MAG: type II toxin-antitoxin system VapC family toxin [Thermoprotei archaeon]